jgi:hypothetical protein
MTSSPYQAIATNEDDYDSQSAVPGKGRRSRSKLLLLALTFCLLAFGFYKAGQWSILRQQTPPTIADTTKSPVESTVEQETHAMQKKYSVG